MKLKDEEEGGGGLMDLNPLKFVSRFGILELLEMYIL